MNVPSQFVDQLSFFPAELVALLEAELEAGNSVLSIERGFPATSSGAYVKLARVVMNERRKSAGNILFTERNNTECSGEFTTTERRYFLLEPPRPASEIQDMDAIREELRAREKAADEVRFRETYY